MSKAKEISALWSEIRPQIGKMINLCHQIESHAELHDNVTADAFQKGYDAAWEDIQPKIDEAYQHGLNDAWEAARKIGSNSMCSLEEMGFDFSQCVVNDYNPSWFVVKNYSASECIEKIRQYEQEKDRQARIEYNFDKIKDVLETTAKECNVSLDEIAEVFAKMKETDNG